MKHFPLLGTLPLAALVSLTACVDNKYDLSDIDTTTEIKVKDLTIPVNLDVVTLGDIISIKEGSELKEYTTSNGETFYAVNKSGTFASDKIKIPGFTAQGPEVTLDPLKFHLDGSSLAVRSGSKFTFTMEESNPADLEIKADDIDDAIISLTELKTEPFEINIDFDASSIAHLATLSISKVEVTLPEGLVFPPDLNPDAVIENGKVTIPYIGFNDDGKKTFTLTCTGIEKMEENGYVIDENRSLNIDKQVQLSGATLNIALKDNITANDVPQTIEINVKFKFSNLVASAVSGMIQYEVEGVNIDPVSLTDLPDFLSGDKTNIILVNPQIYLKLNNPVGKYGLSYQSGIEISQVRDGKVQEPMTLDNNEVFSVAGIPGETNILLSPKDVTGYPEGFSDPTPVHYGFSALSNAIAGAGLPDKLSIKLVNPQIPAQYVTDFKLNINDPDDNDADDNDLDPVEGEWQLLAPLALKGGENGSKIIYTDRKTGWNDPDVDAIKIKHLSLSMIADSDLSLDATLTGFPIDINGNKMEHVTVNGDNIKGMTDNQEISLVIEAEEGYYITHLDGFEFTATVTSDSEKALSPDQTLTLKNIRAKVSGSYTKKF